MLSANGFPWDPWFMKMALEQADLAFQKGEVPIGAVIISKEKEVLASSHNLKEKNYDPCGHAEIIALRAAGKKIGNWRLTDCDIYTTLEPCTMCMGALVQARVRRVIFGAFDPKGGAISLGYRHFGDPKLNHQLSIIGGVDHYKCSKMLSMFFKQRRLGYK